MRATLHLAVVLVFVATLPGIMATDLVAPCAETVGMPSGAGDHAGGECPTHEESNSCEEDSSEDEVSTHACFGDGHLDSPLVAAPWSALSPPGSPAQTVPHRPPIA
jgi:hypothetical protein